MVKPSKHKMTRQVENQTVVDGPTEREVTKSIALAEPLDERFKCPICGAFLKEPRQTPCGHRFCANCLEPVLRTEKPRCPVDGEDIDPATVFADICCQRELLSLSSLCPFKERGCSWKGELRDIQKHHDNCLYSDVQCLRCGENVQKKALEEHKLSLCLYRPVKCEFCEGEIPQAKMEAHLQRCPKVLAQCIVGCGKEIPRDAMEAHVTEDCPKAEKLCPFRIHGCDFKGTNDKLEEHKKNALQRHLDLVNSTGCGHKIQSQQAEGNFARLESENKQLTQQLAVQNEALAAAKQDFRTQQMKLDMLDKSLAEQKKEIVQFRQRLQNSASSTQDADAIIPQMREVLSALELHEQRFSDLERDLAKLPVRNSGAEFSPRSLTGVGNERRQERNEHQLTLHEIRLSEHDMKMQMLQATSYDGNFIWKIDNYSRRFQEAVSGKTPSIYSAPFYVGRFGYKVCARLYPYGDGMGKGSHLSLFFVIMRGEYDALLPWPFRQKVSLRLLDQDGGEDVSDAFRPDTHSASFKKPTSNMNIASGCPLFVSHSALQTRGYIRDNVMFIKIAVDTTGLPNL